MFTLPVPGQVEETCTVPIPWWCARRPRLQLCQLPRQSACITGCYTPWSLCWTTRWGSMGPSPLCDTMPMCCDLVMDKVATHGQGVTKWRALDALNTPPRTTRRSAAAACNGLGAPVRERAPRTRRNLNDKNTTLCCYRSTTLRLGLGETGPLHGTAARP